MDYLCAYIQKGSVHNVHTTYGIMFVCNAELTPLG